eukprot:2712717-Pyramimonas_sp.AAC.1
MAVCRQGIYVEYSMEYSKCRALNGILVSTVEGLFGRRLRGLYLRDLPQLRVIGVDVKEGKGDGPGRRGPHGDGR